MANEPNTEQDLPPYLRIKNTLAERVGQGDWTVGEALPGRSQLCAAFGTTRATLDKAIGELIREGLLCSVQGRGTYVAQPVVTRLAQRESQVFRIGVVLQETNPTLGYNDDATDLFFGSLFQGIKDALAGTSGEIVHAHLNHKGYRVLYHTSALDGMILVAPPRNALPVLRQLVNDKINFVVVGLSLHTSDDNELPLVDADNVQGAADAARHLLRLGHRDIAIVNLATTHANHSDRQESFQRVMADAGVPVKPENFVLARRHDYARFDQQIEKWLRQAEANDAIPTAIFACDYSMADAVLRVLRQNKLRVPEDISVVGFDDPPDAAHQTPPLTTVRQPVCQLGQQATLRLLNALVEGNGTVPLGLEILPTELIIRESTAAPRLKA